VVKEHDPKKITLLCDGHHRRAGAKLLPVNDVLAADRDPLNRKNGKSGPDALFYSGDQIEVVFGGGFTLGLQGTPFDIYPLVIDGIPIIRARTEGSQLLIDLSVRSTEDTEVLSIRENELVYSTDSWDVEFVGRTLTVRAGAGDVRLEIRFEPPAKISIVRGFLFGKSTALRIKPNEMTVVNDLNKIQQSRIEGVRAKVGLAINGSLPGVEPVWNAAGFESAQFQSVDEAIAIESEVPKIFEKLLVAQREEFQRTRKFVRPQLGRALEQWLENWRAQ